MNRLGYGSAKVDNILTYKKIFVLELRELKLRTGKVRFVPLCCTFLTCRLSYKTHFSLPSTRPKPNSDTGGEFKNERDDPLYTGLSKTEK